MHIIRQLFLVRIGLALAVLFTGVFATAFAVSISRLYESSVWGEHTNNVLAQITRTQELSEKTFMSARVRLVGDVISEEDMRGQRQQALDAVDTLHGMVSDNPTQMRNVDMLKVALERRFVANDAQFKQMTNGRDAITLTRESVDDAVNAAAEVERLFTNIKVAEVHLLQQRNADTNGLYWTTTYTMIVSMIISISASLATLLALLHELKFRQRLADDLKQKSGTNGGGLTALETANLFSKIEGAISS